MALTHFAVNAVKLLPFTITSSMPLPNAAEMRLFPMNLAVRGKDRRRLYCGKLGRRSGRNPQRGSQGG